MVKPPKFLKRDDYNNKTQIYFLTETIAEIWNKVKSDQNRVYNEKAGMHTKHDSQVCLKQDPQKISASGFKNSMNTINMNRIVKVPV